MEETDGKKHPLIELGALQSFSFKKASITKEA
jgi:hypothetical protein